MKTKSFLVAFFFAVAMVTTLANCAEITYPKEFKTGELVTFQSDIEGDCLIYPPAGVGLAKDSNKKRFYIVGSCEGEYTFIFFGIENGQPSLNQVTFKIQNGSEPSPSPEPEPEPSPEPSPEPEPVPIPVPILTEAELNALNYAINTVVEQIDSGTIRTPQGARSAFKIAISSSLITISDAMREVTESLNQATDYSNVQTIKTSWKKYQKEVLK